MSKKVESLILFVLASAVMGSGVGYSKVWLFHLVSVWLIIFGVAHQSGARHNFFKRFNSPYFVAWLVFFSWYAISIFWSLNIFYTVRYLFYLVLGLWIMLLITSYVTNIETFEKAYRKIKKWALIAIGIGFVEILTPLRLPTSPFSDYAAFFGRASADFSAFDDFTFLHLQSTPTSFFGNPNNFALAVAMVTPMFWNNKNPWIKYCGALSLLFLIGMAGSRGAIFAVFSVLTLSFLTTFKRAIILSCITIFVFFFGNSILDAAISSEHPRVSEVASIGEAISDYLFSNLSEENSAGYRREMIQNGLNAFYESNGLGVGGGNSIAIQESHGGFVERLGSMHNFWVEILVDGGVVGFTIFFLFYIMLCLRLFKLSHKTPASPIKTHSRLLLLSLLIFAIGCVSLSSPIYFLPMWILFGLSMSLVNISERKTAGNNAAALLMTDYA